MRSTGCNKKQWNKGLLLLIMTAIIAALLIVFGVYSFSSNILFALFLMAFSGFPIIISLGYLFNLSDAKKSFDILNGLSEMDFPKFAMSLEKEKSDTLTLLKQMIEMNYLIAYLDETDNVIILKDSERFDPTIYLNYKEKIRVESNAKQELKKNQQRDAYFEKMLKKGKAIRCKNCGTINIGQTDCSVCFQPLDQTNASASKKLDETD